MIANLPQIRADVVTLLSDGQEHTRQEMLDVIMGNGGAKRHLALTTAWLKDNGYYVGYNRSLKTYHHSQRAAKALEDDQVALQVRTVPEFRRRLKAERGELVRARRDGRSTKKWDELIAGTEVVVSAMAAAAGMSPSAVLNSSMLSAEEELAILTETTP